MKYFLERHLFYKYMAQTSAAPMDLEIAHAEGVFLYDTEKRRYFDLISGVSVSNVGHKNMEVTNAIIEQINAHSHVMVYGEFIQSAQTRYAQFLCSLLPDTLDNVYFVNSGSEAIEGAMKLAKRYTGRSEIIAFRNAYHGSTQGALSLMGNETYKQAFRPLLPDIRLLNFNATDDLRHITHRTACVVVEPIQGEAGIRVAADDFLQQLAARCKETNTFLVFDEIQTGICRTGKPFAFEHYGVVPDILVLAKALGGGMPLGAFIASKKIMETLSFNPVLGHITTFGGHPVSCAAGLAAFSYLQNNISAEDIAAKADLFYKLLSAHPAVKEIRYKGLLMAVELGDSDKLHQLIRLGTEKGFVSDWFLFCDTAFRISPPLTITMEEIEEVCGLIGEALDLI